MKLWAYSLQFHHIFFLKKVELKAQVTGILRVILWGLEDPAMSRRRLSALDLLTNLKTILPFKKECLFFCLSS